LNGVTATPKRTWPEPLATVNGPAPDVERLRVRVDAGQGKPHAGAADFASLR